MFSPSLLRVVITGVMGIGTAACAAVLSTQVIGKDKSVGLMAGTNDEFKKNKLEDEISSISNLLSVDLGDLSDVAKSKELMAGGEGLKEVLGSSDESQQEDDQDLSDQDIQDEGKILEESNVDTDAPKSNTDGEIKKEDGGGAGDVNEAKQSEVIVKEPSDDTSGKQGEEQLKGEVKEGESDPVSPKNQEEKTDTTEDGKVKEETGGQTDGGEKHTSELTNKDSGQDTTEKTPPTTQEQTDNTSSEKETGKEGGDALVKPGDGAENGADKNTGQGQEAVTPPVTQTTTQISDADPLPTGSESGQQQGTILQTEPNSTTKSNTPSTSSVIGSEVGSTGGQTNQTSNPSDSSFETQGTGGDSTHQTGGTGQENTQVTRTPVIGSDTSSDSAQDEPVEEEDAAEDTETSTPTPVAETIQQDDLVSDLTDGTNNTDSVVVVISGLDGSISKK